jgi:hypothetical protein
MSQLASIDLSQDELAFVLTLHNLTAISGFAIPADFDAAAASAAGDSLIERGLAVQQDGGQRIHPDIAALVTSGALYAVALGLSVQHGGGAPQRSWFYRTPERIVFHTRPRVGVERFEALTDDEAFVTRISALIPVSGGEAPGFGPVTIPKSVLARAETERTHRGPEAGLEMLRAHSLPDSLARNVLDETHQVILVVIRVIDSGASDIHAETRTHMLIAAEEGYWLLQENDADPTRLTAQPIDGAAALAFIKSLVKN